MIRHGACRHSCVKDNNINKKKVLKMKMALASQCEKEEKFTCYRVLFFHNTFYET